MSRIDGPSRDDIARRGDVFTDLMVSAIWHTLDTVTQCFAGTVTLDDLAPIQVTWSTYVSALRDHIGQAYIDSAMQTRVKQRDALVQILKKNDTMVASALVAAGTDVQPFEVPLVANQQAESLMSDAGNRLTNVGNEVWEHARGSLLTGMQNGEGIPQLRDRVSAATDFTTTRAELIARSEIANAMNSGALAQMRQIDTPGMTKEWIAVDDGRVRAEHLEANGEKIPLDGVFSNGLEPGEDYNCRCTYGFDIPNDDAFASSVAGCDSPGLSALFASLQLSTATFSKYDPEYARKFREKQRLKRQAERDAGTVVPTPEPPTPPPPKMLKSPIQKAVQTLQRDESLGAVSSCEGGAAEGFDAGRMLSAFDENFDEVFGSLTTRVDELTGDESVAFRAYQDTAFTPINSGLRKGGIDALSADNRKMVSDMDATIARSPVKHDIATYRGIQDGSASFGDGWSYGDMTGVVWRSDGFTSTSLTAETADNFVAASKTNPVMLKVYVPAGSRAVGFSENLEFATENEVLLPRGSTFRVLKDYGYGSEMVPIRTLDVELVLPKASDSIKFVDDNPFFAKLSPGENARFNIDMTSALTDKDLLSAGIKDADTRQRILDLNKALAERFGEPFKVAENVSAVGGDPSWVAYVRNGNTLGVNPKLLNDRTTLRDMVKKWTSQGTGKFEDTLVHEHGHYFLQARSGPGWRSGAIKDAAQMKAARAARAAGAPAGPLGSSLSKYALTNREEAEAELWANYHMGGASREPWVVQWGETYLRELGLDTTPLCIDLGLCDAAIKCEASLVGAVTESWCGLAKSIEKYATKDEYDATLRQALEKIANAPTPSDAAIVKAQRELANARAGTGRAGGESRGGSAAARRKQRQNLFKEFGGDEKGYVICHGCGAKMHWQDIGLPDNPYGYQRFERGKIFVKCQGGGYQLANLLPECFACNRSRNDKMVRQENRC